MTTEQTLKSGYVLGKSLFYFFNLYARFLVSYTVAIFFVFLGIIFFIEATIPIPIQTKLIFLGLSFLLLAISYLFHRGEIIHRKMIKTMILLGNVFGFLFNFIYFTVKIGSDYGYQIAFGGAEKFVSSIEKTSELNLIEAMYGFVGGIIFIISLGMIASYGLSLKDKFKKEGKNLKALLFVVAAIVAAFSLFLLILFYQSTFKFVVYFITGSMVFVYGTNLFKKNSIFLKF
ncbi:MAG: hypothetical protein Q7S18_00870 [bacterium]|nr:hypothetical protein [bacterium]